MLTPRQAAGLLGVSESTLRRWCDAGHISATKTAGGHRRIERQALLEFARHQGLDIVDIAPLATAGRGGRLPDNAELSSRLYDQLVDGDEAAVQQITDGLLSRTGDGAGVCDEVIAPAMYQVGENWSKSKLRIFHEHAATERAVAAVTTARSNVAAPRPDAPLALCAALPGDPYALAPAMCGLVMQSAGFRTTLLGTDTPTEEILAAAAELGASVITISVSVAPRDVDDVASLCERAGELGIRVALGGRQLSAEVRVRLKPDFFGDSMAHLSSYAARLMETLRADQGSAVRA